MRLFVASSASCCASRHHAKSEVVTTDFVAIAPQRLARVKPQMRADQSSAIGQPPGTVFSSPVSSVGNVP
jgi:hypothetical protein